MPEATVLYTVTAVVVLGLVVWVAVVLKTAREPWARPRARHSGIDSVPPVKAEGELSGGAGEGAARAREAGGPDADSTARATPVALASEGKARDASKGDAET